MAISLRTGSRRGSALLFSTYRVTAETEDRLELQAKRVTAFGAAAFLGLFGGIFAGAGWHFYTPYRPAPQVFIVGGLGLVLLALALLMLYFGLRRPDRIVVDAESREIVFARRRQPLRVSFDQVAEIKVETDNRSRSPRERLVVHPVVLKTDSGDVEVDAASDIEEMIRLAAKLRRALDKPLA